MGTATTRTSSSKVLGQRRPTNRVKRDRKPLSSTSSPKGYTKTISKLEQEVHTQLVQIKRASYRPDQTYDPTDQASSSEGRLRKGRASTSC